MPSVEPLSTSTIRSTAREEGRQDPGQRVGLVLRPDDGGEARGRVGLRPAPDDVEVGVVLEFVRIGEFGVPDLARGAVLEPLLQELHAACDLVELPDAGVLVDRVLDDREQRRYALAPLLHAGGVAAEPPLVAVALEVLRVVAVQRRRSLLVVRGGGQRDRRAVLLALLAPASWPRRRARASSASVSSSFSSRPTCVDRQPVEEVALDRPVDVDGLAGRHRRDEAAEVLDHVLGLLGDAREPRLFAEHVEEARLTEQELGLPADQRRGDGFRTTEKRNQPSSVEDPLALLALVVGEPMPGPQRLMSWMVRDVETPREHRVLEDVRGEAGQLGEDPADGRPSGLGNREVEHALLGEDDRPLLDVVGEALFWLGDERRASGASSRSVTLTSRGFRRRSLRKPTRTTWEKAPGRALPKFLVDNLPSRAANGHL